MKTIKSLIFITALSITIPAGNECFADEIAVTVYNSNLGVISEARNLEFSKGINRLEFQDVPSLIDASSVSFDIIGQKGSVSILEQNFAFDLVSSFQMYKKYIDQSIELINTDGHLFSGKLLAFDNQNITLLDQSGKVKILILKDISEVNFPVLPEGLITRPTLQWLYDSDISGNIETNVSYQTAGMSWQAEYIGILDNDDKNLDLNGWSSITNNSGKTYKDASLKLVAGEINRERPEYQMEYDRITVSSAVKKEGFTEKEFFEYHLYTLPRKTTVANGEIKQISLFEPAATSVEKIFLYQPSLKPDKVKVAIKFKNAKSSGLGIPLPAGRIRIFKADEDGSHILLGEDLIDHTPSDEEITASIGYAFDIVAEENLTDRTKISATVENQTWKIELRNRKKEDIKVTIEKNLYGFWNVIKSDMDFIKKDANTITFEVALKAEETKTVNFTVQFDRR